MNEWRIGNVILNCDVSPNDISMNIFEKKMGEHCKYPRCFFVKLEHIPTGITVTKSDKIQLYAFDRCLKEIDELVKDYEYSQQ